MGDRYDRFGDRFLQPVTALELSGFGVYFFFLFHLFLKKWIKNKNRRKRYRKNTHIKILSF